MTQRLQVTGSPTTQSKDASFLGMTRQVYYRQKQLYNYST